MNIRLDPFIDMNGYRMDINGSVWTCVQLSEDRNSESKFFEFLYTKTSRSTKLIAEMSFSTYFIGLWIVVFALKLPLLLPPPTGISSKPTMLA